MNVNNSAWSSQCIVFSWGPFFQEHCSCLDLVPFGVFSISRDWPAMWGILGSFWLRMLELFQRFSNIIWHWYVNLFLFIVPNLLSIWVNCVPTNPLKLQVLLREFRRWFLSSLENILLKSHPHISNFFPGIVIPKSSCEGSWIIFLCLHVIKELIVGYYGCLI